MEGCRKIIVTAVVPQKKVLFNRRLYPVIIDAYIGRSIGAMLLKLVMLLCCVVMCRCYVTVVVAVASVVVANDVLAVDISQQEI